ncbi:DUF4251 domain-containing protein [uncultured Croceitalea sp.]|uniref:DUF4251 domain-containing protein n=1 Tax=uncultured Croceitalea sp. TaxID=1798908 RepID=UPI003305F15B
MKKLSILITIIISIVLTACSATKTAKYSETELSNFKTLVESQRFNFNPRWANPMGTQSLNAIANAGLLAPGSTVNRIDLIGTAGFFTVKGDSVMADLPYYGERQMGGAYNPNDIGINFEGVPRKFKLTFNEKKQAYEIKFDINNGTEVFNVNGVLFPNKKAMLFINTSQRLTIQYQGDFEELDDKENVMQL